MAFDQALRAATIREFLGQYGWGEAVRDPLGQDASTRRYERLKRPDGGIAILMDAPMVEDQPCPPGADDGERLALGWNALTRLAASRVDAFVAIAGELQRRGLSAPVIYAHDSEAGLALIEDFGALNEFARLIERGVDERLLYTAAAETLAGLHRGGVPEAAKGYGARWPIQAFDRLALDANTDLFAEWLPQFDTRVALDPGRRDRWQAARDRLVDRALDFPRAFTLRDYHAENLVWLPSRTGVARVGLLDFQDAVVGWDAWDLTMLVHDARRPVSEAAREAVLRRYCELTGKDRAGLDERLAVIGALNAMRITGLFARLVKRDGKPRYLDFMARQQAMLALTLRHPATAGVADVLRDTAPFILETAA
ncbi:MAG: phosphotransferase [Pseudomonadota bacterium]